MKKILVIGSSGLLGSHLVNALRGKAEVVEAAFNRGQLKVDIADPASLRSLFQRVGFVARLPAPQEWRVSCPGPMRATTTGLMVLPTNSWDK